MRNDACGWVLMEAGILALIDPVTRDLVSRRRRARDLCPQCAARRAVRRAYGCGVLGAAGALWNGGGT